MAQPYDYGAIMRSGQNLIPDLFQQMMVRREMDQRNGVLQQRQAEQQQEQQEAENYQRDLDAALLDGSPEAIQRLMMRYPDMAESIKPAWEAMDEDQRSSDLTQTGTIYARANANDYAGAATMLRARIDADRAAGQSVTEDEAILAGLESDDPIQQNAAKATIGIHLAALTGDKFSETYGRLNPSDAKTANQREYEWREQKYGRAAADSWLASQNITSAEPGATIYNREDFVGGGGATPANGGGGDQSTGGGAPPAEGPLGAWIEQTAGRAAGAGGRQRATGVPGTYHGDDNARDFPTASMAENVAEGRRLKALFGPSFDVIYSETDRSGQHDDHVHVEPGPELGAKVRGRASAPVRVSSVQQANALAAGTRYITPDGRTFVR